MRAELAHYRAALPEWVREAEAQQLTGLSQATLAWVRKKPDTLLAWKSAGGLRYERRSVLAFNEAAPPAAGASLLLALRQQLAYLIELPS